MAELLERVEGPSGPRLEAVRALVNEQVAGDWPTLARLMVDPVALTRRDRLAFDHPDPRAVFYEDYRLGYVPPAEPTQNCGEPHESTPEEVVRAALDTPDVCFVRAEHGPERTEALAGILRGLAADGRRTLLLAPSLESAAALLDVLPDIAALRAELEPGEPDPLEELKRLRRELLWLEQWPRDLAALTQLREHSERRRAELAETQRRMLEAIQDTGLRIETADRRAAEARERLDQAAEEHRQAAEEAARLRAEAADAAQTAEAVSREAEARTRDADSVEAGHQALAERVLACEQELNAARAREASLTDEVTRATETLPEATRETEDLEATATETTAEQHASYYRLAAAESAHAAKRRKLSWGQRLHVAPVPPEVDHARQEVKWRKREAEQAAERARAAAHAHQQAQQLRAGLAKFIADGEQELAALAQTEQRLGEQLTGLVSQRDAEYARLQEVSRLAAEAIDQATQATAVARHSAQVAAEAERRATGSRQAEEEAAAGLELIESESAQAREQLATLDADLERHRADGVTEIANLEAELRALTEAEQRSRRHTQEILGTDPSEDALAGRRTEITTRVEVLSATIESATVLYATPIGFAQGPYILANDFEALLALEADRLPDPDLLIGAVHTRRWLLVADGHGTPPHTTDPSLGATQTTFDRCFTSAPTLCHSLIRVPAPEPTLALDPLTTDAPPEEETPAEPILALDVPPQAPAQEPAAPDPDATPLMGVPAQETGEHDTAAAPKSEHDADATRPVEVPGRTPEIPAQDHGELDATTPEVPPRESRTPSAEAAVDATPALGIPVESGDDATQPVEIAGDEPSAGRE